MFAYFKGIVEKKHKEKIILEVNNIGYEIYMTEGDIDFLKEGETIRINTYTDIKEGYIGIFGFLKDEVQSIFEKLKKVSGVGSKSAMQILSNISVQDICLAIVNEDSSVLKQVSGIGPKTAGRIILELKDNIMKDVTLELGYSNFEKSKTNTEVNEAILALKVLGYMPKQINEVLSKINIKDLKAEEIIKKVLSNINI